MDSNKRGFGGFVWVAIIIVIVLGFAVFAKSGTAPQDTKIKVAVLLPLSTDWAWWGESIKNGITVAAEHTQATRFEFIYEDTKCSPKDAVSATQSLKARHPDIHIFIVGCDSDLKAMTSLLDPQKDLAFMVGLSGADLYESNFPIINLAYRLETEGTFAAQFASEKLGVKKLGIIVDNGVFGGTLASSVTAHLEAHGGSTVVERIKYNEPNPETSVLKVLHEKPDAVYIQNDIPTVAAILKRLDQLGYAGKRIVYYGGRDQSLIDGVGAAAEEVYVPWPISDLSNSARTAFIKSFKEKFNVDPFITAYFAYDGIVLLDEAQKECQADIRCIEEYFYNKNDFVGVLGKLQYERAGNIKRDFYFQQIRDGQFVEVE